MSEINSQKIAEGFAAAAEREYAGKVDPQQLAEVFEADEHGGVTWTVTIPISLALCPSTKCTKEC